MDQKPDQRSVSTFMEINGRPSVEMGAANVDSQVQLLSDPTLELLERPSKVNKENDSIAAAGVQMSEQASVPNLAMPD